MDSRILKVVVVGVLIPAASTEGVTRVCKSVIPGFEWTGETCNILSSRGNTRTPRTELNGSQSPQSPSGPSSPTGPGNSSSDSGSGNSDSPGKSGSKGHGGDHSNGHGGGKGHK